MKCHRLLLTAFFALLLSGLAGAAPTLYHSFRVTVSLTYVTREPDKKGANVLVTRRLTNKQLINLARGRDPEAAVPKNEILVALLPDSYLLPLQARVVVMDTNTATILRQITTTDSSEAAYGLPVGSVQGVGSGKLLAMGGPNFFIGQTQLSLALKGFEKPGALGPTESITVLTVSGPLPLTVGGVARQAIVTGGSVRITGKNLYDFYGDF